MKRSNAILALTCTVMATSARAEGDWIVGLLGAGGQSPYVGSDDEVEFIPYVAYETDRFHIGIDEISYDVIENEQLEVSVVLAPRFAPDLPDSSLFDELKRDDAAELGVEVAYDFGDFHTAASFQGDVSGAHDGSTGKVAVGYEAQLGFVMLDLKAGVTVRDANLNNYLYGVTAAEETAERTEFTMNNTINAFAEVSALMPLSETMFLYGEVSFDDLGEAFDSPLVDRQSKTDVALGLIFQF